VNANARVFRARFIINAAGLFADDVCRMVGIDDVRIRPRKGEEFLLDKKKEHLTNRLIFPLPNAASKGTIVIKTSDGNPMIGPTADDVDDKYDLSTSAEGLRKVFEAARRMVPSVCERDIIAYFAGLRPVAGDDFVIRHEKDVPGFVTVAGIQSPGLTAAPAIAEYVRDILQANGLCLVEKKRVRPARQKAVHLFSSTPDEIQAKIRRDQRYGDIVCRCEMVSAGEIEDAIDSGACTLDGIKFRTRAQAGRCHGSFCTTRIMKMLAQKRRIPVTAVTKRGEGSEVVVGER
jgi:glycerol-3-phosphate dehydrogenase